MRPAREDMRQWRGRAETLRGRLYRAMRDPTVRANARTLLAENRPEAVAVLDRISSGVGFSG